MLNKLPDNHFKWYYVYVSIVYSISHYNGQQVVVTKLGAVGSSKVVISS